MAEQNDKPEKAEAAKPPKGDKPVLTPEQEAEAAAKKAARAASSPGPLTCTSTSTPAPYTRRPCASTSLPPSGSSEVNRHACANSSRLSCGRA